jgi:hypothetical protein
MTTPIAAVPAASRAAWVRLRDELTSTLGDDLVSIWAYGSTIAPDPPRGSADLDAHVIVGRSPDGPTARRIEANLDAIARDEGVEWEVWVIWP